MVEWSITPVLKTGVLRGTGGSNPSLSANIAENQQVTNLHPDLHPLLVNLGVILHPLFGAPLIDDMLKVLKFKDILIFSQLQAFIAFLKHIALSPVIPTPHIVSIIKYHHLPVGNEPKWAL